MSFPTFVLTGTTIADADLDGLQQVQSDPHGLLLPRHKAAYDFAALAADLPIGTTHPSLTFVQNPAEVIGTFGEISALDKGLRCKNVTGNITEEKLRLPSCFDLSTLGDEPSFILSMWLTQKFAPVSAVHALVGYGVGVAQDAQWWFDYSSSTGYRFRCLGTPYTSQSQVDFGMLANDTPTLLTAHVFDKGNGTFGCKCYKNNTLFATAAASPPYPIHSIAGIAWSGNPPYPLVGRRSAYNIGMDWVLHRLNMAVVPDPAYNALEWVQAEYAANVGRF